VGVLDGIDGIHIGKVANIQAGRGSGTVLEARGSLDVVAHLLSMHGRWV